MTYQAKLVRADDNGTIFGRVAEGDRTTGAFTVHGDNVRVICGGEEIAFRQGGAWHQTTRTPEHQDVLAAVVQRLSYD